jgi:hydroxylamine reductase (hybrid-cluster protein)
VQGGKPTIGLASLIIFRRNHKMLMTQIGRKVYQDYRVSKTDSYEEVINMAKKNHDNKLSQRQKEFFLAGFTAERVTVMGQVNDHVETFYDCLNEIGSQYFE